MQGLSQGARRAGAAGRIARLASGRCRRSGRLLGVGLALALSLAPRGGRAEERPADETLRAIAERGRLIAGYVQAVSKARDLLAKQGVGIAPPDSLVATLDHDLWTIAFLRDPPRDESPGMPRRGTLLLGAADYSESTGEAGTLRSMVPPQTAPATLVSYGRALKVAETAAADRATGTPKEHDASIVRERDGSFTIYLIPRPEDPSKVPFGTDLVVRVAANGRQLQTLDPLHTEGTEVPLAGRAAGRPTLHIHKSGDLPTPTDVALVLLHTGLAPHLVLTPHFIFRIDAEGTITYLGPNQTTPAPPAGAPGATPAPPAPGPPASGPAPSRRGGVR